MSNFTNWTIASKISREIEARNPNTGPHGSHCWMNQYPDGCKYGSADSCPARPKVWPHRTFDEDANIVLVTEDGDIFPENALEKFSNDQLVIELKRRGYSITKIG